MPWTPLVKLRCSNPHQGSCTHQHHQLEMQARRGGRSEGPAGRKEKNRMRLREGLPMDQRHAKLSSAAVFVRKLHDLAVQKRGYVDLLGAAYADNAPCYYGHTLPKDSSCTMPSSWSMTDPTTFLIRGESYLLDRQKIKAENTLMQMVGADWIKSDKREDDLAGCPWGTSQEICSTRRQQIFLHCKIVGTPPAYSTLTPPSSSRTSWVSYPSILLLVLFLM